MENRLNVVLKYVSEKFKIKQWNYVQNGKEDVENYFGILIPVTIKGRDERGPVQKSIFIKFAPSNKIEQLEYVIKLHYEVEIYTYSTLIPIYKNLTNINLNMLFPECYYTNLEEGNEVLVLSDMRSKGYQRYEGKRYLDFEHTIVSLNALATFHALSIIYKEKGGDFNTDIMKPYSDKHPEAYYLYIKDSIGQHKALFEGTKYEVYVNRLQYDLHYFLHRSTSEAIYLVYGHGDFWHENILFKYQNSRPTQACMIDFQKSRIMSPAHDVLLFLLTSVEPSELHQYQEYFLNNYINELQSTLQSHGLEDIYSLKDFLADTKTVAPYCIATTMMAFSLWLGLEGGDVVKSKNECNDDGRRSVEMLFKNIVTNVLDYMSSSEYIDLNESAECS